MSAREVHVRIGRLVVDAPLGGDAAHWGDAIAAALRAELTGRPGAKDAAAPAAAQVPGTIARHIARQLAVPQESALAPFMPTGAAP